MAYWQMYTCDKCEKPFTAKEWDARATPHHVACSNYDPDDDKEFLGPGGELVEIEAVVCTCDRNYHAGCFDWDNDPEALGVA